MKNENAMDLSNREIINILVATDHNYLKYTRVLMVSIYENHPGKKVDFYVLHDKLNNDDEAYLNEVAEYYGQKVTLVYVDASIYDDFPFYDDNRWSVETMYRLLAHQVLPQDIERILYLDIDIVVDGDLMPYYSMEFDGCYLIASKTRYSSDTEVQFEDDQLHYSILDPKDFDPNTARSGRYFNAGVILFNLKKLRETNINAEFYKGVINRIQGESRIFNDQGLLNMAFVTKTKLLSSCTYQFRSSYGFPNDFFTSRHTYEMNNICFTFPRYTKPVIYHYTNTFKPWTVKTDEMGLECGKVLDMFPDMNPVYEVWWKYAEKVPDYLELLEDTKKFQPVFGVIRRLLGRKSKLVHELKVPSLEAPYEYSIRKYEDLNAYIFPGNFRCRSGAEKKSLKNLPESFTANVGFRLTVKQIATVAKGYPVIQILEPNLPDAPIYRRYCGGRENRKWGQWIKLVTDAELADLQQEVQNLKNILKILSKNFEDKKNVL